MAMGAAAPSEWSTHVLPSGSPLGTVLLYSVNWLSGEGYVRSGGLTPYDQLTLTEKGLAALNARGICLQSAVLFFNFPNPTGQRL
jgi:hypothetical protein